MDTTLFTTKDPKAANLALNGPQERSTCVNGYWRSFDTDYPCPGCRGCGGEVGFSIGLFIWKAANLEAREGIQTAIAGLAGLARIGAAVASAGKLGVAVGRFIKRTVAAWDTVRKGQWYEVTGKRGNAKAAFGFIGECVWLGEVASGTAYRPTTTTRVGLKAAEGGEPVWVPASCITRITPPAGAVEAAAAREAVRAAALAERQARPTFTGKKGTTVKVTTGKDQGATGKVFWLGNGRNGIARVGLKDNKGQTIWADAADVVAA